MRPQQLIARIGRSNAPSIKLFESLGFGVSKVVEVFDEVELRWGHEPDQAESTAVTDELGYSIPEGIIGVYDPRDGTA